MDELVKVQWGHLREFKKKKKNPWAPNDRGTCPILWDLPPGAQGDSHSKYWGKIPLSYWKEEEKKSHTEIHQSIKLQGKVVN